MRKWLNQFFCVHWWQHLTNIDFSFPGSEHTSREEVQVCRKCGKTRRIERLF